MNSTLSFPSENAQIDRNRHYTYEELCEVMGETLEPHELWRGKLLLDEMPSFQHQEIVFRLGMALITHVKEKNLGKAFFLPVDVVLTPDTLVHPDVGFLFNENLGRIGKIIRGPVDLAMEVISPWGRHRDRIRKRALYALHGIREYWIVDPERSTVEALSLQPGRRYELIGSYSPGQTAVSKLLPGFQIDVGALFGGL